MFTCVAVNVTPIHVQLSYFKKWILFVCFFFLSHSESDLKILTVLKTQLPVRMTHLRWKIIVTSIILMVQFESIECLNNTTVQGKLPFRDRLYVRGT